MIQAFQSLPKTTLAKKFKNFKAEANVIFQYHIVVSSLIVIAIVVGMCRSSLDLFSIETEEVDLFVVKDFAFFIVSQVFQVKFQSLGRGQRKLYFFTNLRKTSYRSPSLF